MQINSSFIRVSNNPMIFLPVHSSFLKYTSQFFLQFLFWRIWPQYLGTHTNSVTLKYVWVQHWNLTFLLLYMQNIYIERERERACARLARGRGFEFHSGQLSIWNQKTLAQYEYHIYRQIPLHAHDYLTKFNSKR